jgi:rare lipoprotein A (peptidoglycan hydrolase)
VYTFLGMFSGRLKAHSWYAEKGLASHYGKNFEGRKPRVAGAFRQPT